MYFSDALNSHVIIYKCIKCFKTLEALPFQRDIHAGLVENLITNLALAIGLYLMIYFVLYSHLKLQIHANWYSSALSDAYSVMYKLSVRIVAIYKIVSCSYLSIYRSQ